ncbi:MAG: plasmid recombination protein [Defluviitaleaceae bacterium]|nr:plasmid recombination protein [Defluviitaleaceae bacterium]
MHYARESLHEAYQNCFGQALENYNAKQKRSDRKIENYYSHLFGNASKDAVATSSNKEKSFYEIVVGIGDKNTCAVGSADGEIAARILDEYAKSFSERNPNFYVFNSVLHLDEKTPHLHIDYVPVADGYKNGMEKRNSISVALEKMGFGKSKNSINEWRIQERQILREICEKHGLEIAEETKGRGKTFTPDEYKKIRDEAKDEIKADPEILDEIKDELREHIENDLLSEKKHLTDEITAKKQAFKILQAEKSILHNELEAIEGKRKVLEAVKAYAATPSKLNKDNVVIPLAQYNDLKKTAIEGAKNSRQLKELRDRKKQLDNREQGLNDREGKIAEREYSLDEKLKTAKGETQRYRQLYSQEKQSTTDLTSQLTHQKREAKRWEDNYNNLHRQYVQLKRSKGLVL